MKQIANLNQFANSFFYLLLIFVIFQVLFMPAFAQSLAKNQTNKTISYFSTTYSEARQKFVAAVNNSDCKLEHYQNPNTGFDNEELYTDVATCNLANASKILVLGSGTHGVEGFAGSAIQTGLLLSGITQNLPEDVGLVFYHALNPYGFSQLRRFNEDNVDVNRNFVTHTKPYPPNKGYDELAWIIEPDSLSLWNSVKANTGLAWYRLTKGKAWLQQAISQGQFNHPHGLFFGGNSRSWSNQTLETIIKRHLSSAARVIIIDIHTGLGEYASVEMITEAAKNSDNYRRMYKIWGDKLKNPASGESVSPPVKGPLKRGFTRALPGTDLLAVSMEFGTSPPLDIFWAMRAENYLHHHPNDQDTNFQEIKSELKRVFYPENDDWKRAIWLQGKESVQQALNNLSMQQ